MIADAAGCMVADIIDDYLPLPPSSRSVTLADDPMLPMLLDSWLLAGVIERAQIIEYARSITKKENDKKGSKNSA